MKTSMNILALICALAMVFSLAACGEKEEKKEDSSGKTADSSTVDEPDSDLTDFEWVKFEMPEGFADAQESDFYVTIKDAADDHHLFKLFNKTLTSGKTIDDYIADENEYSQNVTEESPIEVSGRTWKVVHFDFNEPSAKLFTQIDDTHCAQIVVYDHLEDDAALLTVLNSIEFDVEKF